MRSTKSEKHREEETKKCAGQSIWNILIYLVAVEIIQNMSTNGLCSERRTIAETQWNIFFFLFFVFISGRGIFLLLIPRFSISIFSLFRTRRKTKVRKVPLKRKKFDHFVAKLLFSETRHCFLFHSIFSRFVFLSLTLPLCPLGVPVSPSTEVEKRNQAKEMNVACNAIANCLFMLWFSLLSVYALVSIFLSLSLSFSRSLRFVQFHFSHLQSALEISYLGAAFLSFICFRAFAFFSFSHFNFFRSFSPHIFHFCFVPLGRAKFIPECEN